MKIVISVFTKEAIIAGIKKAGKVYVHSILGEFPIEKKAAIEYVENNRCQLLVWEDGYKRLEASEPDQDGEW